MVSVHFFITFSLLQKMYLLSLYYLKLNVFFKCLCWYDPICTTLKSWRYHSNMTANQLVDRVSLTWIWGLFWDHARGWCLVIRSAEGTKQKNYHTRAADSRWTPTCSAGLMSVSDHFNILSPFVPLALSHSPWHLYTSLYAWVSWIHVYPIFHIVCFWRQSLKSVFTAIIKAVNSHLKSCVTFILRPKYILWLHEIFHGVRNLITLTHALSNTMTVGGCDEIRQQQRVL